MAADELQSKFRLLIAKLRQQAVNSSRRETSLVARLAEKEDVITKLNRELENFRRRPNSAQKIFLEPGVHLLFGYLRRQLKERDTKIETLKEDIEALQFNDNSVGTRLKAKCRMLMAENEELGQQLSEKRIEQAERKLVAERKVVEELKKLADENDMLTMALEEIEHLQQQNAELTVQLETAQAAIMSNQPSSDNPINLSGNGERTLSEDAQVQQKDFETVILNESLSQPALRDEIKDEHTDISLDSEPEIPSQSDQPEAADFKEEKMETFLDGADSAARSFQEGILEDHTTFEENDSIRDVTPNNEEEREREHEYQQQLEPGQLEYESPRGKRSHGDNLDSRDDLQQQQSSNSNRTQTDEDFRRRAELPRENAYKRPRFNDINARDERSRPSSARPTGGNWRGNDGNRRDDERRTSYPSPRGESARGGSSYNRTPSYSRGSQSGSSGSRFGNQAPRNGSAAPHQRYDSSRR